MFQKEDFKVKMERLKNQKVLFRSVSKKLQFNGQYPDLFVDFKGRIFKTQQTLLYKESGVRICTFSFA